jgi:two-component system, NtrC family, response regulator AtoC
MPASQSALIVAGSERAVSLRRTLGPLGLTLRVVTSVDTALEALGRQLFDVVVAELDIGDASDAGVALLSALPRVSPGVPVLVLASPGSGERAAEIIGLGAADFLEDPVGEQQVVRALEKALAVPADTSSILPRPAAASVSLGESKPMRHVQDVLRRAAPGTSTILIRGESGTGKELVARLVHEMSPRKNGPFVKVHCAALPDTLLESELFGYERGAFTGAVSRKPGRVELANRGTLFLDEIGDITLAMQVKLLRLLQDREFERLGGNEVMKADVRFIAATHRDLDSMVKRGEFREDLFYRLNVVTVWLPPLRARRDDVPVLARRFISLFGELNGKPQIELASDAVQALRAMRWPGNVRQLQNFVEKLVVLSEGASITAEDVRRELSQEGAPFSTQTSTATSQVRVSESSNGAGAHAKHAGHSTNSHSAGAVAAIVPLSEELRQTERRALLRALEHTKGNRSLAARVLGVSRATLYKKLEEHDIR